MPDIKKKNIVFIKRSYIGRDKVTGQYWAVNSRMLEKNSVEITIGGEAMVPCSKKEAIYYLHNRFDIFRYLDKKKAQKKNVVPVKEKEI